MPNTSRTLAVFDFDDTLVQGDSFWPFLAYVAGWPRTGFALGAALFDFGLRRLKDKNDPALQDPRTFIKLQLMQRLLAGRTLASIAPALQKLRHWQKWYEPMRKELLEHKAQGHCVVIASGGLDLYLPTLLQDIPHDALICTETGVENSMITGTMPAGNCVRQRKAELVAAYITEHGPFASSWGYGNYPHDVPMMNLLKHRIIV